MGFRLQVSGEEGKAKLKEFLDEVLEISLFSRARALHQRSSLPVHVCKHLSSHIGDCAYSFQTKSLGKVRLISQNDATVMEVPLCLI